MCFPEATAVSGRYETGQGPRSESQQVATVIITPAFGPPLFSLLFRRRDGKSRGRLLSEGGPTRQLSAIEQCRRDGTT
jgi:hypothetical protein